jgi:archaemetzincin
MYDRTRRTRLGIVTVLLLSLASPIFCAPNAAKALVFATSDDSDFAPMPKPGPSDWIAVHKEPAQSFQEYVRSNPLRPAKPRTVLVLVPIGPFEGDRNQLLARADDFAHIFFQLEVRTEESIPLPTDKGVSRTNPYTAKPQYLTTHILFNILQPRLPKDAFASLGITMSDLYPDPEWNFVFGQASFKDRVGVYSLVRFTPEFSGMKRTPETDVLLLLRTCKVLAHETGHMFGLAHCTAYSCCMNGSNSLDESDRQPLFYCPVCLKKLQWNVGFDVLARYQAMHDFCVANDLKPEADWLATRIAKIKQASEPTR